MKAGLADLIDTDHRISDELFVEPSHGHTPGHVHLCIESKGERGVITGDLMHHPIQCALPHRPARFDMDTAAGQKTRIGFVDKYKDSGVLVIGAHLPIRRPAGSGRPRTARVLWRGAGVKCERPRTVRAALVGVPGS